MKEVYQVIFTKLKKGNYLIEVPDLDCLTEGKNLNDAIKMARDAIGIKGITLEDMGEKIIFNVLRLVSSYLIISILGRGALVEV